MQPVAESLSSPWPSLCVKLRKTNPSEIRAEQNIFFTFTRNQRAKKCQSCSDLNFCRSRKTRLVTNQVRNLISPQKKLVNGNFYLKY